MRIHVYTVAWNEEMMMPFFLRHYSRFCEKIVVFDNESTDGTREIVSACPQAELRSYATNNQSSERSKMHIRNSAYKESRDRADWVIVCDVDEFLYHPRLLTQLRYYRWLGVNFPKVRGFDMVPDSAPGPNENLAARYRFGVSNGRFDKRIIFSPHLEMQYAPGSHSAVRPSGARESLRADLKLLHYKMLNQEYFVQRNRLLGARRSEDNVSNNWASHYVIPPEAMREQYKTALANRLSIDSWRELPLWHEGLRWLKRSLLAWYRRLL